MLMFTISFLSRLSSENASVRTQFWFSLLKSDLYIIYMYAHIELSCHRNAHVRFYGIKLTVYKKCLADVTHVCSFAKTLGFIRANKH